MTHDGKDNSELNSVLPQKNLSEDAKNALAEAAARKSKIDAVTEGTKDEEGGRGGLDPARYGDWEVKGISSDF